ncbi:NADH-quinone oxidoreductase subunit C [Pleionea litopenaei]|uniref:NADH-quinone oxidoreductase subunit C n=1 Tax=Pleionea litopenaei TaxID=3070815 RepID=A0AA51X5X1_9GAMM|nr:NADH-quinone oxidoreductase subunit C [Pleionea sp. HL-JVS1]WMS86513.1 NADH-quinone oxidoreductase subunit C [Pleionea sp. HL-JVS1]
MALESLEQWKSDLELRLKGQIEGCWLQHQEVTIEVSADHLLAVARRLRDEDNLHFEQLIDLCGVDYLHYGQTQWDSETASGSGFSRAVEASHQDQSTVWSKPRFAVVYHLLSVTNNRRLRMRCFVPDDHLMIPSMTSVWSAANWYEREAFDLYGIRFEMHDDLRRLLTDYGFVGYPFRKDFPLIGDVEIRYDATEKRCVYEPVSIEPRTLVPKVIRHDARYVHEEKDND